MPEPGKIRTAWGGRPGAAVDLEEAARGALARALARSRALLEEARREAEELARRKVEEAFARGREEGWACGFREGREAGASQALTETRPRLERAALAFGNAARGLGESREAVGAEAQAGVVRLAAAIGEKIAARAIALERSDAAVEAVREALRMTLDRAEVRVRVSPDDFDAAETARGALREEFPEIIRIAFEKDPAVAHGGCRIVTATSTVDATLEERAARIAELLVGPCGSDGRGAA